MTARLLAAAALLLSATTSLAQVPKPGKYGCTETMPRYINGSFEYEIETRGIIILERGGRYTDPYRVAGRYATKGDTTRFTGGLLDHAMATPMKDDRLRVVIPTAKKERRWACGLAASR